MSEYVNEEAVSALGRFDNYDLDQLTSFRATSQAVIDKEKVAIAEIDTEYLRRFGSRLVGVLHSASKQSTTVDIEGGFKAKGSISKTVKWDSDVLQTIAASMTWEEIKHYFKIDFAVPEAIFKALPPGKLKEAVQKARTVKYGDLKVAVEPTGA